MSPVGRGPSGYGPRDLLVFAEVALASVLVVVALMVSRLYGELNAIHPSFDATSVAVADVGPEVTASVLATAIEEARAVPGVVATATVRGSLFTLGGTAAAVATANDTSESVACSVTEVSADYFQTLQLPLVAGRTFDRDAGPSSGVAIVNLALARRLWGAAVQPGGRVTVRTNGRSYELQVVGIAAEALAPNAFETSNIVYLPRGLTAGGPARLLVRTAASASLVTDQLSRTLTRAAGRSLRFRPLEPSIGGRDTLLIQWLLSMFGALALMLAAGGIFAVSRHAVLQRTREFGIRLSLGATAAGLIRMVLGRDMKLSGLAVVLAAGGTLAVTRAAFWEMLILAVRDPWFWVSILLLLGGVSTIACYTAARRIGKLQPMDALRSP